MGIFDRSNKQQAPQQGQGVKQQQEAQTPQPEQEQEQAQGGQEPATNQQHEQEHAQQQGQATPNAQVVEFIISFKSGKSVKLPIPLNHASDVYEQLIMVKKTGENWERNGFVCAGSDIEYFYVNE